MHHGRVGVKGFACAHRFVMSICLKFNELVILVIIVECHVVSLRRMKSCVKRRLTDYLSVSCLSDGIVTAPTSFRFRKRREHDNGLFLAGKQKGRPVWLKAKERKRRVKKRTPGPLMVSLPGAVISSAISGAHITANRLING